MPMTVEEIEAEVLKLPEPARAELLGRLMRNLVDPDAMDPDAVEAWVQEAGRRDEELESGSVVGIPAEDVFNELKRKGK